MCVPATTCWTRGKNFRICCILFSHAINPKESDNWVKYGATCRRLWASWCPKGVSAFPFQDHHLKDSCFYCSDSSLACNLALVLPAAGVLQWLSVTTSESVIGGISVRQPTPPTSHPLHQTLMAEDLQALTAALKLESKREHNGVQECLDCLDRLSLPQSPGKMVQPSQSFTRTLDSLVRHIYA